ncbi:unnamed protein product [Rotaria sp. Silwood2]|nr:unnamed protein product [Rotaria sp. Silwood2]CAF4668502.1 unnamed protein product [Rotaria sp. Silwood2]
MANTININIEDLDNLNIKKIHQLTMTQDIIGSTIHSDEWRGYLPLGNENDYTHLTVNHSVGFINSTTGVHAQKIENTWMRVKIKQKKQSGIRRTLLLTYLEEFMWRQHFGGKPFKNLVLKIHSVYPVA